MNFTEPTMRTLKAEAYRREHCLDRHATAEMLDVDVRTLQRWHNQGIGPKRQNRDDKRPILYRRTDVEQFAALRKKKRTPNVQPEANGHPDADANHTIAEENGIG